jgi:twitching motility protein PilT
MKPVPHPLFENALDRGASDLHLQEGRAAALRVHGDLVPVDGVVSLGRGALKAIMSPLCSGEQWRLFEQCGDVGFAGPLGDRGRFRASYHNSHAGWGATFRILPAAVRTVSDLWVPDAFVRLTECRSGMIIVAGQAGSGKTTTLAAMVDHINAARRCVIVTVEKPVEYIIASRQATVAQRQIGTDAVSYADALLAAMRQDADVLMVGELRDAATISLALTAAESGLLVLGSLNTSSATKTVYRIIEMFPQEQQDEIRGALAATLCGICAQALLRRSDGAGRIAAHEVLISTSAVANIIRENIMNQFRQTMMSGKSLGMQLMDDVLRSYVAQGLVTADEAESMAVDRLHFSDASQV